MRNAPTYRHAANEHEAELISVCGEVLTAFVSQLEAVGLTANLRGITDLPEGGAEITIDFVGPHGIADVLEFTIARTGAPTIDAARLRQWLHETLPSVAGPQ